MDSTERRHAAGLMRINHVGEVCAQGLYFGQAAVARDPATREHLLEAAQEETDHLAWCATRLGELDSRPSLFNPLWYAGSYTIGTLAGLRGDGWNLGFVVETERQVEGPPGRAPGRPAGRRPAQPRGHRRDEGRRGPPCGPRRTGRRTPPAVPDPGRDGAGFQGHEDHRLPAVTAR
jgi:hypothetical protein